MNPTNSNGKLTSAMLNMVPWRIQEYLRMRHREWTFRSAMKSFATNPRGCLRHDGLDRLIYGWNNDWSAGHEYLEACLQYVLATHGAILECGSGLSTLLVGLAAQQTGSVVWTLEHGEHWGERVARLLEQYGIQSVRLCICPLRDYGEYVWYDAPLTRMPDAFAGVVCDGPPGDTRGGRYGMMPLLRTRLRAGAWVMLDDASRDEERAIAARWASETGSSFEVRGVARPYIAMTMPGL